METRQRIEQLLAEGGSTSGQELAKRIGLTRQAVNRHLRRLLAEGRVVKSGTTRNARYRLLNAGEPKAGADRSFSRRYPLRDLEEDRVFRELSLFLGLDGALSQSALEIYRYALTEIVNNAIDHSFASSCTVSGALTESSVSFAVQDAGVGIFASIARKFTLADEVGAVVELSKGKRTTQPDRHTGEGVFFASKCADRMEVVSHRLRLIFDNRREDAFVEEIRARRGTSVTFEINPRTRRRLAEVFGAYAPQDFDFSFQRTRVTVKLLDSRYLSRSEAKRLLAGLDKFRQIVLDFRGVAGIGQGFADEIFRVFAKAHPEIAIAAENANPAVSGMIEHARGPGNS